jgi:hypothetical protein
MAHQKQEYAGNKLYAGNVQLDDAYLAEERIEAKTDYGTEAKSPIISASLVDEAGAPST